MRGKSVISRNFIKLSLQWRKTVKNLTVRVAVFTTKLLICILKVSLDITVLANFPVGRAGGAVAPIGRVQEFPKSRRKSKCHPSHYPERKLYGSNQDIAPCSLLQMQLLYQPTFYLPNQTFFILTYSFPLFFVNQGKNTTSKG